MFLNLLVIICCTYKPVVGFKQGWEFAHRISERIARFLLKNERMGDLLKKMSDSERFDHIAHFW